MARASGSTAVMAQKRPRLSDGQVWQDLELFPTPPWATRALFENVLPALGAAPPANVWEPCAGLGHMSEVICEYAGDALATDVHAYGPAHFGVVAPYDFLSAPTQTRSGYDMDWIITNPPFGQAAAMARHALAIARVGVAFLLRLQFLESEQRFALFRDHPPIVAQFTERVPMCEGGYDPQCSTATAYAWFVWSKERALYQRGAKTWIDEGAHVWLDTLLIPPGRKRALFRPDVDLKLAARHVPGFVPPSTLKKTGKAQLTMAGA